MSKFTKVMIALLAIAVFAAPAIAEDRLGLSGQMRVLYNYVDNDAVDGDNTKNYLSQRLRLGGKFSIAEGVSVSFRTDITEATWGTGNGFGSGRTSVGGSDFQSQHYDRAHLDLDFGSVALRAGQQFVGFGANAATVDIQSQGFKLDVKGAVPVTLFWMLPSDNGSSTTDSDDYTFGVKVGHKTDMYKANVFIASQMDDAEEVYVAGVDATFNLEALTLTAEVDYFTGDANATTDAVGLQGYVDAAVAAGETMTVGGQVYYAQGADTGEMQYTVLGNGFNGWDPMNAIGVGLDNVKETFGNPYALLGNGAGIMALRAYTTVKVSDAVTVGASAAWGQPEDDDNTAADSFMHYAAGVAYKVMSNTSLKAQVAYEDVDAPGAEEVLKLHTGLIVSF